MMILVGVMRNITKETAARAAIKLKGKGLEEKLHVIIVGMRRLGASQNTVAFAMRATNHSVQRPVIIARMPKNTKRLMLTYVIMTNG